MSTDVLASAFLKAFSNHAKANCWPARLQISIRVSKVSKKGPAGEYKIGMFNKQVTKDNLSENSKQINNSGEGN
jgi:hypothetical protein